MASLLSGVLAAMLLAPMPVAAVAPTLTVTIPEKSYVDGGPVKPTVKLVGAAGNVTFTRFAKPDCSGDSKPFGTKAIGANATITGPNVNDLTLGKFGLYAWYKNAQGLTANACVPFSIQRHSHVFATLPKQQFDIGQAIEPTVTLGTTPDAGGKVDYHRFATNNCTGTDSTIGTSEVVNGVVQQKRNYQDGELGVRSYRVVYSGDTRNSGEQSVCRPYAVGAFIRGMVFKDANNNGVLDPGEVGVSGVKLTLRRGGSTVDTVTTATTGVYELFVIATGQYLLVETQPPGYGSSTPNELDLNISGPSVTGKNFGETSGPASPSPSPSASEPQPSPSDIPTESPAESSPPSPEETKASPVNVLLWVGIGLVLLATVLLLVLIALARRREE